MAPERRVPIQKSELSILDNEFSSIRERFEAEMKKMEEEMSRFRSQLLDHERDFFSRAPGSQTGLGTGSKTWLDGMNSPLIQDAEDGSKQLKLRFDVSQYVPEEIVVKTVDNRLQVRLLRLHILLLRFACLRWCGL
ncbi:heat shock protein beta-1 [Ixodes scapularis]